MKHFLNLILALSFGLLATSCGLFEPKDPIQADMEEFAKQALADEFDVSTFDFQTVSYPPNEHKYYVELEKLRAGLEKQYEGKAVTKALQKAYDVIDQLEEEYGFETACIEYVLHFWGRSKLGTRLPLMVFAVYDMEGNRLWASTDRNDIPTYPALNMLRDSGELNF